ncbi:MAG: phytanoyl-CoA dioxygenase family protein, partial [Pseudohongiella sp.]
MDDRDMAAFTHNSDEPHDERSLAQRWDEDGYLLLRGFFDPLRIRRINDLVDRLWDERRDTNSNLVIDVGLNTAQHHRIRFHDAPDKSRTSPHKINDLYLNYEEIRQVVLDQELTRIIGQLLQGTPLVINTLNFELGSQQDDHVDTFYMPPRKQNCMLATWIALEPVSIEAGPIRYYPRSHKIPPYLFSHGKTNAIA